MEMGNKRMMRAVMVKVAAVLLLVILPCSALADGFSAIVTSDGMYVAADPYGQNVLGKLDKNTVVTVTDYADGIAKISYKGHTGYARVSDMTAVDSIATQAITITDTYAFQKPSTKSKKVKVKQGTIVNVLATQGSAAMVEKDGVVAYMYVPHLLFEGQSPDDIPQTVPDIPAEPEKPKMPSFADAYKSGSFSNEQLCYLFLTQVMGYNNAAAAGVLANISYESGFKTTINGDSGTSYGLCQWHAARKTRLLNYCADHDLSADSLLGQLAYLKYELENYYSSVHKYLKNVSNTAEGAYDAGYYFCYNFEAPASRTSQSTKRGSSAQNTYFGRYASI